MSRDEDSSCGITVEVVELPKNGVGLVDNPILVLVYFHKALRAEFAELRHIAVEALESGTHGVELLVLLRKRFEFLKLFYKYHSAAEDEASLIWQFMCSVPVTLLEEFLPWMISVLSSDEQIEVSCSMKEIVPKEKLLQEVVISSIDNKVLPVFGGRTSIREQGAQFNNGLGTYHETSRHHSFDGIRLWHDDIRKDLQEFSVELYQIRISSDYSDLPALVV